MRRASKVLSAISLSVISAHLFAAPVTQSPQMSLTTQVNTILNVNGFNNVNQNVLSTLQTNPDALENGATITDTTSLQSFKISTNSGGGVTVTATNSGTGNTAELVNSTDGSTIPYSIMYTPCDSTSQMNLSACTGTTGCTINAANATETACASSVGGNGEYIFGGNQSQGQVTAGTYTGTTTLTISAGL